jgi:cytochrome P450
MNMILFMLAGYETTSSTLTYCSYILAKHPEEQHKLIDEINSHFNKESKVILQIFFYKFKKFLYLSKF